MGFDASRIRSGGGQTHIISLIEEADLDKLHIREIHIWAYRELLDKIPNRPWLKKHNPTKLNGSLLAQLWWQAFNFSKEFRAAGCDMVFNLDAGTVSNVTPSVTLSQDMLSYEPGEIERFGWGLARLRLIALRYFQNRSLRKASGAIFLSKHAAKIIQQSCGELNRKTIIPNGVSDAFDISSERISWPRPNERPIRCLCVSNAALYKHQWHLVAAIAEMRQRGDDIRLQLVGGGKGAGRRKLNRQLAISDPRRSFVDETGEVPHTELPKFLRSNDIFVFASSCESMPNTLIEAMASGIPIACARRGPMPEILQNGGVYFDPEDPTSISEAIAMLINKPELRVSVVTNARRLSEQYSWRRCASETWSFLAETCALVHGRGT